MPGVAYQYIQDTPSLAHLATVLPPEAALAIDTETTGLDPLAAGARLLLLQIGTPDGAVYVVNACTCDLEAIRPALENGRLLIGQNIKFDCKWLRVHAGIRPRRVYDTQIAELILVAGLYGLKDRRGKASLKALAEKYCGVTLDKKARLEFVGYQGDEFPEDLLQYAADDIPHLFTIKREQTRELQRCGLVETAKLEFGVLPTVGEMELEGVSITVPEYREVIAASRVEMERAAAVVAGMLKEAGAYTDLFGDLHVNLGSPEQLKEALKLFGIETKSTDEKALQRIDHPFAQALLTYRKWETEVTSFGENVLAHLHPVTGRLHPEFNQLGGDAGRFTAEKPNVQQIPADKKFRRQFVPRPGNVFVIADWQAMEMRILARISGDPLLLQAFMAGRDLHSHTAATMYGLDYEAVVAAHKGEGSPERKRAKVLNFALCYGMGVPSIAEELKCSNEEAQEAQDRYFAAFPGVAAYLQRQDREGPRTLEVRTLGGRRRIFNPPKDKREVGAIARRCRNTPMQGTNADAVKRAMIQLAAHLEAAKIGPGIVMTIHDELVTECPRERGQEVAAMVEADMNAAASFYLQEVPAVTEVKIAEFWLK